MFADVGVVRRALERDVQRDLDPEILGGAHEVAEVVERAELWMDRLVPALGTSDGPRAADVVGAGGQSVVLALARRAADRMDGRQVHDVEPELSHVRQHLLRVAEGAVPFRIARGRARKKFVPGAEDRTIPLGEDAQLAVEAGGDGTIRVSRCRGEQAGIDGRRKRGRGLAAEQGLLSLPQPLGIRPGSGAFRPSRRRVEKGRTFEELGGDLSPDFDLALQLVHPGAERVRPGLDAECVEAVGADRELRLPGVVAEEPHRLLARLSLLRGELAPADHGGEVIVALLEDVGGDADRFPCPAPDRIASAIDLRLHVFNDRAPPALGHRLLLLPPARQGHCMEGPAREHRCSATSRPLVPLMDIASVRNKACGARGRHSLDPRSAVRNGGRKPGWRRPANSQPGHRLF